MWKRNAEKEEEESVNAERSDTEHEAAPGPERTGGLPGGEQAVIGSSIRIQGEVAGDEDLVIQGQVEGSVNLDQNSVTVGPDGKVTADLTGRIITVEGHVEGDLTADEKIILRSSARVEGDITAPRVVLEDGASFRGGVEMGEPSERSRGKRQASSSTSKRARSSGEDMAASKSGSQSGEGDSGTDTSAEDED